MLSFIVQNIKEKIKFNKDIIGEDRLLIWITFIFHAMVYMKIYICTTIDIIQQV